MSFSISVKDYAIGAGETLRLNVPGTFFQLMEATAAVSVSIQRAHSIFGDAENVPLGFSVGPLNDSEAFDGVEIYSDTAQTVKVCIARGAVDLRSITQVTGTVSVINGELERVLSGAAFSGVADIAAAAGVYSHVQLWNPAASAKNLIVTRLTFGAGSSVGVAFGGTSAALTTLVAAASQNKKIGGAAGVAELRAQNDAALLVSGAGRMQYLGTPASNTLIDVPFSEQIVVPPGYGLTMCATSVNIGLYSGFQWIEEAA